MTVASYMKVAMFFLTPTNNFISMPPKTDSIILDIQLNLVLNLEFYIFHNHLN